MIKKVTAVFLAITMLLSSSPLTSSMQEPDNPFSNVDAIRQQSITLSQQQSNPQEANAQETNAQKTLAVDESRDNAVSLDEIVKYDYNVQFKTSVSLQEIYNCVIGYKYKLLAASENRLFKMEIGDIALFNNKYREIIDCTSKITKRTIKTVPNDAYYADQWALPALKLPAAWDVTKGLPAIKVGIIDSGFYRNHEDLSNSTILQGFDVCKNTPNVTSDEIGHGTMVASVIAATTNNGKGIAGTCWNITVIPYKVANSIGLIDSSDVISAIRMAADSGCDVINLSLGGYEVDPAEQAAVDYAIAKGCIIVASSGNEGSTTDIEKGMLSYPASEKGVISVAAINNTLERSYFSQYNNMVDVCAPGENILVASNAGHDSYELVSGTSFSSPYVAAIAALVRSREKNIGASFFEQLIKETSTDKGSTSKDDYYGWGLINAEAIVNRAIRPIICGVDNNSVNTTSKTITFNKGTAMLNGIAFSSGSVVANSGNYTLVVTDTSNNSTTIHFSIDKNPITVSGIVDGGSYNSSRTITFTCPSATLNGAPFISGTTINAEGSYTLILTGAYGASATYGFKIDKTNPVITGVEEGRVYSTAVTLGFNEGIGLLNGVIIEPGHLLSTKNSYTLVVTDPAGNSTTLYFSLTKSYPGNTEVAVMTELSDWILDETSNTLFAITKTGNELFCIDATTLEIINTIILEHMATDIIIDNGKLYVSLDAAKKIVVFDMTTKILEKTIITSSDPYRIAKDGNKLYYTEYDQWCDVFEYDLSTDTEVILTDRIITGRKLYKPDLSINTESHILYIGESGLYNSDLYYYNTSENKLTSKTNHSIGQGFLNPDRSVLYDGKYVFYAGRSFSPISATEAYGDYNNGESVIFAKEGFVFTNSKLYDEDTHIKAGDFKSTINLVEASENGSFYIYDVANACIARIDNTPGTNDPESIITKMYGILTPGFPTVTESNRVDEYTISLPMDSELKQWVNDDESDLLYAIAENDKAIFFIDADSMNILKTIRLTSQPTDIFISNRKLYIPLNDTNQIAVVDIVSQTIEKMLYTSSDPYRVVLDGNKLYYSGKGESCEVFEYDLDTDMETKIETPLLDYPDLAINTYGHVLYIGDTNSSRSTLYYYDTLNNAPIGYTGEYGFEARSVVYDGLNVYYSGEAFDPLNPAIINGTWSTNIDEYVLYADQGLIFTNFSLYYYAESYFKLFDFESEMSLIELSGTMDLFLYDKAGKTIMRQQGEDTPPEVTGVTDGLGYIGPVTITFDKGTATLDGGVFINGGTVSALGEHTLAVTSSDNLETIVVFTIYAPVASDVEPVVFNDIILRQALLDNGVDRNNDNIITKGEMRIISKVLILMEYGITDLKGLEAAVNLDYLDLSWNQISDIKPLAGLTGLTSLSLWNNQISDLSALSNLININSLDVAGNMISDISVLANFTNLGANDGWLYLEDNQIADISVLANFTGLMNLSISNNPVSDFTPLQNLTNLTTLFINGCGLTNITVLQDLTNLQVIDLRDNNIQDISPLQNMENLYYLDLSGNSISNIGLLQNLPSLNCLYLSDNGLTNISQLENFANLSELDLSNNNIVDITPLQNMAGIVFLDLSGNSISNVSSLQNSTNLYFLNLSNNSIQDISPIVNLPVMIIDVSENYLDLTPESADMAVINGMIASNAEITLIYTPQKTIPAELIPAVITVSAYTTSPTNQNITVTVTTDKGTLNTQSHTFTTNGSFDFVATVTPTNKTTVTVTITNIDKTAPVVTGVTNNASYNSNKTITINEGTAKLNGSNYASGTTVSAERSHTLVVTDAAGNVTTVNFKIDKTPPVITFNPYSTATSTASVTVTASTNEGTLNTTSHTFTSNGSFDFVATDTAGNTTTKTVTITNILTVVKGDVTGDGVVDVLDLLKLKKYLLGQITLSEGDMSAADATGDGAVDVLDLLKIKKYLLGQISL